MSDDPVCPACQRPVLAYVTRNGRYLAPHRDARGRPCQGSDVPVERIPVLVR